MLLFTDTVVVIRTILSPNTINFLGSTQKYDSYLESRYFNNELFILKLIMLILLGFNSFTTKYDIHFYEFYFTTAVLRHNNYFKNLYRFLNLFLVVKKYQFYNTITYK